MEPSMLNAWLKIASIAIRSLFTYRHADLHETTELEPLSSIVHGQ